MSVNSVTFVAPNLAWGEARGGSIPRQWGCDRRATKPQAKFGATLRAAVLFGPGCVARSLQIRVGYARVPVRKHLAPGRGRKLLAANVTEFTLMTTKSTTRRVRGPGLQHCRPRGLTRRDFRRECSFSGGGPQGAFKMGARTAVSARSWLWIKFARTRLSALLSRPF